MKKSIASPARRLGGYLLDSVIIGFPVGIAIGVGSLGFILVILIGELFLYIYYWSKGTSPGKSALGMTVVNKDNGNHLSFGMMFIRATVGKIISGLVFSLGYLWILWDQYNQCWHDKFVNSVVVLERQPGTEDLYNKVGEREEDRNDHFSNKLPRG